MSRKARCLRAVILLLLGEAACLSPLAAEEPVFRLLETAEARYGDGYLEVLPIQDPFQGQSEQIQQPPDIQGTGEAQRQALGGLTRGTLDFSDFEQARPELPTLQRNDAELSAALQDIRGLSDPGLAQTAAADIVPASTFTLSSGPDAAQTLVENATTQTVHARRRSPVAFDYRIRGYSMGQILTHVDGAYYTPVREDMDTVLSKIDSYLVADTQVISGPYGLRYGSGFSFINVDLIPTPRYECGSESHLRLGSTWRPNGDQWYNRATMYGGGSNYGYYLNLGNRQGNDYEAGNGLRIPSSYDATDIRSALGFDLDDYTRAELRYYSLGQDDTEFAGQFFDVNELNTTGFSASIIRDLEHLGFAARTDAWINKNQFNGDTADPSKRRPDFPVLSRVDAALIRSNDDPNDATDLSVPMLNGRVNIAALPRQLDATVNGELISAGGRTGITQEFGDESSVGFGTDIHYLKQNILETFNPVSADVGLPFPSYNTRLPDSDYFEPGIYAEGSAFMLDYWKAAVGARLAYARTETDASEFGTDAANFLGDTNFAEDDLLASAYLTNDLELSRAWSLRAGVGMAERAPSLTQRYTSGLFLALLQSGFSRLVGNPSLDKERNFQADVRLTSDYDLVRTRFSAFHAWIQDYITYEAALVADPTGARLLRPLNTDLATLTGFELYGEADLTDGVQGFTSLNYLDGRDRQIDQPLGQIYPLEAKLGLRLLDRSPRQAWGVEWGWRIVDNQDRLAHVRSFTQPGNVRIPGQVVALESETPGFATSYLRGYWTPTETVNIIGGVENLFDRLYYEHLDLRLPAANGFDETIVFSPGISPYVGIEVTY